MPTVPSPYEAELIALIPALKGFAYRFVKNSYDAEDLVQETIARALAHINRFDGQRDGLRRWAFTILRNAFINDYKRAKREPVGAAEDVAIIDVPIGETQYRTIRLHEIEEALSHLSARDRYRQKPGVSRPRFSYERAWRKNLRRSCCIEMNREARMLPPATLVNMDRRKCSFRVGMFRSGMA